MTVAESSLATEQGPSTEVEIDESRSWLDVRHALSPSVNFPYELIHERLFLPNGRAQTGSVELVFLTFRTGVKSGFVLREAKRRRLTPIKPQAMIDVQKYLPDTDRLHEVAYLGAVEVLESMLRVIVESWVDGEESYGIGYYQGNWPPGTIFPMRRL